MVVAALDGGKLIGSDDEGRAWHDLPLPVDGLEIVALDAAPDGTLLVAGARVAELTLWCWKNLRGWSRLLVEPSPEGAPVALAVSSTEPAEYAVAVGLGRCVLRPTRNAYEVHGRERRPVWRSIELGREVASITALAASPVERAVFAATNAGVFVSLDGGDTFADWSDGLTNRRIVAVAVSPNYSQDRLVYALGLGGTIWRRSL
jgi:hypothetical protein